jgi:hypothetical protein
MHERMMQHLALEPPVLVLRGQFAVDEEIRRFKEAGLLSELFDWVAPIEKSC